MTPLLLFCVFAVVILFSMLGLGGGILYVPILLASGMDFHHAVATSLSIILVMSLTSTFVYHREKLIDWHMFILLEPVAILGAAIGSYNSKVFPQRSLEILFAVISILSAFFMFLPEKPIKTKPKKAHGVIHKKTRDGYYSINLWAGVPVSAMAGFVSSIIGIGGGFAKVPLMKLVFGTPVKIAVATSSAMLITTTMAGLAGHSMAGNVDFKLLGILACIAFAGAFIGSKTAIKADRKVLNIAFGILQLVVGTWMIIK